MLGRFLRAGLPPEAEFDCLVPTPLHWTKRITRGFNQSALLAAQIGRATGLPVVNALRKVKRTPAQSSLRGTQRRLNVRDAFSVGRPELVRNQKILLVDDVLTTGATANACATALKGAGANYVAVLALARADRRVGAGPEAAIAVPQFPGLPN